MQNSRLPSHVHRVVIANITDLTIELTNARLHVARHATVKHGMDAEGRHTELTVDPNSGVEISSHLLLTRTEPHTSA